MCLFNAIGGLKRPKIEFTGPVCPLSDTSPLTLNISITSITKKLSFKIAPPQVYLVQTPDLVYVQEPRTFTLWPWKFPKVKKMGLTCMEYRKLPEQKTNMNLLTGCSHSGSAFAYYRPIKILKVTFPGRDSGRAAKSTPRRPGHTHPKDLPRLLHAAEHFETRNSQVVISTYYKVTQKWEVSRVITDNCHNR